MGNSVPPPPPPHNVFFKTQLIRKFTNPNILKSQSVWISKALLYLYINKYGGAVIITHFLYLGGSGPESWSRYKLS
jgi:hypothetical protein